MTTTDLPLPADAASACCPELDARPSSADDVRRAQEAAPCTSDSSASARWAATCATRLRRAGHTVVGYDRNPDVSDVGQPARSWSSALPAPRGRLGDGAGRRPDPRHRHGARRAARRGRPRRRRRQLPVDRRPGARRACSPSKGIGFVDCGVSGGVWGLENGYALMSAAPTSDVAKVQPVFDALKPEGDSGFVHAGSGRRRPLRQDGPQRHRVRHHAGLRRGLGAAASKVDLVDNVTEVFKSWREGTVIRSWLLDLLVAALEEDPDLAKIARLRRGLRRGPLDRRGRDRQRRADAGRSPPRCSPGSPPARTTRPAMKAIAAMRNQFGGHAVTDRRPPPGGDADPDSAGSDPLARRPPVPARLPLLRRGRASRSSRASTAFIGPQRAGQDQPGRGDRLPRHARLPPGRDRRAAGPGRAPSRRWSARRSSRDGRTRRARGRDQPRPGQPGPGQPVAAPAGPRGARPAAHGAVRARGPRPGQGRPGRAAPLPRRPAGRCAPRGSPASAPTTTGCCKQRNALLKTAGAAPRRGARRRDLRTLDVWDAHLAPASAPSCWPAGCAWSRDAARRYVGKAYDAASPGGASR